MCPSLAKASLIFSIRSAQRDRTAIFSRPTSGTDFRSAPLRFVAEFDVATVDIAKRFAKTGFIVKNATDKTVVPDRN
jgi:hypothetical protein